MSSVQNEARTVDVHSCTSAAAKIHGTRSALGRAGPEAVSASGFCWEPFLEQQCDVAMVLTKEYYSFKAFCWLFVVAVVELVPW